MRSLNITAIIIALNEQEFIDKCLSSIYPFAQRIFVITNYDTDYHGNKLHPDKTIEIVINYDDPEMKIILISNRNIMDETIQRNWAIATDESMYHITNRRILPHAYTLEEIRKKSYKTDYYWIVDADEIYDIDTMPDAIEFLRKTKYDAILIRGHTYFKKWNYRISLQSDHFWQIGFLRPNRYFYCQRRLYFPRILGWLGRINEELSRCAIDLYCKQTKLPETIAHFHHGAYVGDDERIQKKLMVSSHASQLKKQGAEEWFNKVWKCWEPTMKNFYFQPHPEIWASADHIPTEDLPSVIRNNEWTLGLIE